MRSYFDHNAIAQGRQRVRYAWHERPGPHVYSGATSRVSADAVRARRVQAYFMAPLARRLAFTFHA